MFNKFLAMYFNNRISSFFNRCTRRCRKYPRYTEVTEQSPLLGKDAAKVPNGQSEPFSQPQSQVMDAELTLKDCEELGMSLGNFFGTTIDFQKER